MHTQTLALTDRRCEECDLYMRIADRTPGGAITQYVCAQGHTVFIGAHGEIIQSGVQR